jgi:hypothetical protein
MWKSESERHKLSAYGIKTKPIIFQCCGEQKKVEFVKLSADIYSKNKDKIKKLFKEEGLIFDRGKYLADGKFIWESDTQSIELIVEDDNSVLRWESDDFTPLYEKLKIYTTQLGGFWSIKKIEPMTTNDDLKRFDNKYMNNFIRHEQEARKKGFKHCPVLIPMVKEYIEQRKELDRKNINVIDIIRKVNKAVN